MSEFVADTYALVAAWNGSRRYRPYFEPNRVKTTMMNVLEFAGHLLRTGAVDEAGLRPAIVPWRRLLIESERDVFAEAAVFRHAMRKAGKNCSYIDAWGYATARAMHAPFLTGDEAFKGVPHVEFVKE